MYALEASQGPGVLVRETESGCRPVGLGHGQGTGLSRILQTLAWTHPVGFREQVWEHNGSQAVAAREMEGVMGPAWLQDGQAASSGEGHSDRQVCIAGRLLRAITRVSSSFEDQEDAAQKLCECRGVITLMEMTKVCVPTGSG